MLVSNEFTFKGVNTIAKTELLKDAFYRRYTKSQIYKIADKDQHITRVACIYFWITKKKQSTFYQVTAK